VSADKVQLWKSETGAPIGEPFGHAQHVRDACFSADGLKIATASKDQSARIWDVRTQRALTEGLRHSASVERVRFSGDGRYLVTGCSDGTARVWDVASGEPITERLRHDGEVLGMAFRSDNQRVATASWDGDVKVWDASTGVLVSEPLRGCEHGHWVGFTPDQRWLITEAWRQGPVAKLWPVPPQAPSQPQLLAQLAEGVAGVRLDTTGVPEPVPWEEFFALKQQVARSLPGDDWTRLVQWFLADRSSRNISPWSMLTLDEYVQQRLTESTNEALHEPMREALDHFPTNAPVMARLARSLLRYAETYANTPLSREATDLAAWYSTRAFFLAPENPEVRLTRVKALQSLEQREQADREAFRPDVIPRREPRASPNLIDLTRFHNAGLGQSWLWGTGKSDLAALPQGVQSLAGVEFDVRGVIQVGWRSRIAPYTNLVAGITVEQSCHRLHFLHAAVNAFGETNGTPIGRYVIHHSNGQTNNIPIIIGQHLAHWQKQTNEISTNLVPAWVQSEESAAKEKQPPARLFKFTWENPLPDVPIKSLDLISTHTNAAPFVVAITAE